MPVRSIGYGLVRDTARAAAFNGVTVTSNTNAHTAVSDLFDRLLCWSRRNELELALTEPEP
jgi:hypothetical protein